MTWVSRLPHPHPRVLLALAIGVSAAALVWVGYDAVVEWQHAASLVASRRAESGVDLLVSALSHDMRGAQVSALESAERELRLGGSSPDLLHPVASAFARYPYVDVIFAWHAGPGAEMVFYSRTERQPAWLPTSTHAALFPVATSVEADLSHDLLSRIHRDTDQGRRFSVFALQIGGVAHQVVATTSYRDATRAEPTTTLGIIVNLAWTRAHYFDDLATQVAEIGSADRSIHFAIYDEHGEQVVGTPAHRGADTPTATRTFPVAFFDPADVAIDPPQDLGLVWWTAVATAQDDPTLAAAERGARRTLAIAAVMTLTLGVGLIVSLRAARASANLVMMRSDFVSAVTHELKTPIANMRAINETLASGRTTPEMTREYAQMGIGEATRLTRLVDNLLAYSRVTDVADVYSFEPLALSSVVQRSLQEFSGNLTRGEFEVHVDVSDELPLVHADPNAMDLMVNNLVDNAIRYSTGRRFLSITAQTRPGWIILDVTDQGVGIPEDELTRVTRKFFRGRGAVAGGSGLGLAIVDRIVTDHSGHLAIRSIEGQGTTVSVTIPVART